VDRVIAVGDSEAQPGGSDNFFPLRGLLSPGGMRFRKRRSTAFSNSLNASTRMDPEEFLLTA
jgi:hypothetical protein